MHALAHPAMATPAPVIDRALDRRILRYMNDGAHGAALALLVPRLGSGARDLPTLDQAASCYWHLGDTPSALNLMEQVVTGWPDLSSGWTKLASVAASVGQMSRARSALEEALARNPKSAQALALLNRLDPIGRDSVRGRRLIALSKAPQHSALDRALAHNTLGRINEGEGRHAAAFRHFTAANRIHGPAYHPREISAMVAAQVLRFDPDCLPADSGTALPRMTFLVGMPRSGTTLLEAMLARHDDVRTIGETQALGQTVMALRRFAARQGQQGSAWDWFGTISEEELGHFRQFFQSFLPIGVGQPDRMLVAKMPLDCFDLGAARMLFPDARFVYLDRHPLDVGLSNFTTVFHAGNGFSRRLDWTGHMIRAVASSAADYEAKLGKAFRRQSYRALVETPDVELRALLDHLGLGWQPECLKPEQGGHVAVTASAMQVRNPINRDGLGKWETYGDALTPLIDALGGPEKIAEWEAADRSDPA